MRSLLARLIVCTAAAGIVLAQSGGQKTDPFTGSWKLNVTKSTMSGSTASRSETVTYKHVNGEEIYSADAVTIKGEAEHTDYRGKYDGPYGTIKITIDGKVTSDGPLQLRQLDPRTRLRVSMSKDGMLQGIIVRRLSDDGKTITSSILSFDKDGRIVNGQTRFFEKQ
jgi:hypothetical protein